MAVWPITSTDVSDYIGPMTDADRCQQATDASVAYVESRRSDLEADLAAGQAPADVWLGAVVYASLVYNQRSSPTGYSAYGDGAIDLAGDPAYPRAMRLIGWKRPVAL
jgi:hypothetical protein